MEDKGGTSQAGWRPGAAIGAAGGAGRARQEVCGCEGEQPPQKQRALLCHPASVIRHQSSLRECARGEMTECAILSRTVPARGLIAENGENEWQKA